ncbi:MAG: prepilin-type N-terminal cleavage/methylation domain-containing protein [Candidatus Pacebacteria bacterium]|nr:prepilin-type N-terminal cleavage/methylation domain-containing protein [Candidatus Paceibacterota bacterium]
MQKKIFDNVNIKGFTLIELMVAILIVGVLSGLIIAMISMSGAQDNANLNKNKMTAAQWKNSLIDNLVGDWNFDETSGTTAYNSSDYGSNLNGTFSASPPTRKSGGDCISGGCLEFDGTDDFVSVTDSTPFLPLADSTVALWAYNGLCTKSYPTFYNRHSQSATLGFWWVYTGGTNETNITWQFSNGTAYTSTTWSNVFEASKWSYLVFAYNNTAKTVTLYVNSTAKTTQSVANALPVLSGTLYVGAYNATVSNYAYKGKIDELQVFDKILTVSQIQQKYFAGVNKLLARGEISIADYAERLASLKSLSAGR